MLGQLHIPSRRAALVIALIFTGGLVFLYWNTYSMDPPLLPGYPGDAFFPRLVIGFTLVWAVLLDVRLAMRLKEPDHEITFDWLEFAIVAVLAAAFAYWTVPLGFETTATVLIAALLIPRLRLSWPKAVAIGLLVSAATMLVLWSVFGLMLKVPLPLTFLPLYLSY